MSYTLQALIGKQEVLSQHASAFPSARVVPLAQGVAMIPMTDALYEEIGGDGEVDTFYKFAPGVEDWALQISYQSPIAYVEAEYFGGVGDQSSVAWSGGSRVLGPIQAQDAINQSLRLLGVSAADTAGDEFDAVGLGTYRCTESWISQTV